MKISMIRTFALIVLSGFIFHFLFVFASANHVSIAGNSFSADVNEVAEVNTASTTNIGLFDSLHLGELGLSRQAYDFAMKGFQYLAAAGKLRNKDVLSVVDFNLASSKKRLFIIDLKNQKLLFHTYVSHGRNSGKEKADQFSNEDGSFKSSLGFYVTKDTYEGKHGFSLRLNGEERGINDNALSRGIVMHSAAYVDESLIRSQGYIGRSQGCPAVPEKLHKSIIEKIRNGSCFFIYSPDKFYVSHSGILKQAV